MQLLLIFVVDALPLLFLFLTLSSPFDTLLSKQSRTQLLQGNQNEKASQTNRTREGTKEREGICVCVCVRERERERSRDRTINRLAAADTIKHTHRHSQTIKRKHGHCHRSPRLLLLLYGIWHQHLSLPLPSVHLSCCFVKR